MRRLADRLVHRAHEQMYVRRFDSAGAADRAIIAAHPDSSGAIYEQRTSAAIRISSMLNVLGESFIRDRARLYVSASGKFNWCPACFSRP